MKSGDERIHNLDSAVTLSACQVLGIEDSCSGFLGSLENEREFLAEISPIRHVERISAPLFVIHSYLIYEALSRAIEEAAA